MNFWYSGFPHLVRRPTVPLFKILCFEKQCRTFKQFSTYTSLNDSELCSEMARDDGGLSSQGRRGRPPAGCVLIVSGLERDAAAIGAVCAFLRGAVLSRADASDVLAVYARLARLDAPQHVRPVAESISVFLARYLTLGASLTPAEVALLDRALVLASTALQRAQTEPALLALFRVCPAPLTQSACWTTRRSRGVSCSRPRPALRTPRPGQLRPTALRYFNRQQPTYANLLKTGTAF
mgnify:CR=1 FL=1